MSWQVIADTDFTAAYGSRVLSFVEGELIVGEVARYLAAAGAPVTPAPELELDIDDEPTTPAPTKPRRSTGTTARRSRGGPRQPG